MNKTVMETTEDTKETEILKEIRESEQKADEIVSKAEIEKQRILNDARRNSSKLLVEKKEEIRKAQEKKIMDFRGSTNSINAEKIADGKKIAGQIKAKAEKNMNDTVNFVMKKFEEMV